MRELVRLAEVREAQAKEQITALLDNRSNMFQSQAAAPDADADMTRSEQQIEEAQRTKALAKKKFNKARSVCIAAQQVGWACPPVQHLNASCFTLAPADWHKLLGDASLTLKCVNGSFTKVHNSCTVQCMLAKWLLVTHCSACSAPNSTSIEQNLPCTYRANDWAVFIKTTNLPMGKSTHPQGQGMCWDPLTHTAAEPLENQLQTALQNASQPDLCPYAGSQVSQE